MKPASPYLTAQEAKDYLRLPSMGAFYTFRSRHKRLRGYRRGGTLLFKVTDLDGCLEPEPKAARHPLSVVAR